MKDGHLFLTLVLTGDAMRPDEITARTGIVPDEAMAKGERGTDGALAERNRWRIRSTAPGYEVAEHWATILPRVEPGLEGLEAVARDLTVRLTVTVDARERIPSVMLMPDMVATLARLGATVDLDYVR